MKRLVFGVLIASAFGCGKAARPLENYIAEFERESGYSAANVTIALKDLGGSTIGICWRGGFVQIDATYWSTATEEERTLLIWHELGHCVLGKTHVPGELTDRCPASLMNAIAPNSECADKHIADYKEGFEAITRMNLRAEVTGWDSAEPIVDHRE